MDESQLKVIHYRWTAQDVEGASHTPGAIQNPYGINPDEVFVSTGKASPSEKRGAKQFVDGEEVDLPVSVCRLPCMLNQFFVTGYRWEEAPKDLNASTIGELCQKLADRGERYALYADFASSAAPPKTPEAQRTAGDRKRLLAKKLFWYWKNTDYRWALLHSGVSLTTIDRQPETLATQARAKQGDYEVSGALTWVLARHEMQPRVSTAPNTPGSADEKKVTTIVVKKALDPTPDPPPKPFDQLDPALVETLRKSFVDRVDSAPLSRENLMYGFRDPPPKTLWEALQNLGLTAVNLLVRMFDRMKKIDPSLALWRQIKYIRNQWWGGSGGMKVIYHDPKAVRVCLDGLLQPDKRPTVARDKLVGSLEHQSNPSFANAPLALKSISSDLNQEPPDCNTWREVDKLGEEAMHFCVDKGDLKAEKVKQIMEATEYGTAFVVKRTLSHDDIHIDWVSPVEGIEPGKNQCKYAADVSLEHWFQAMVGYKKPVFYFSSIEDLIERIRDVAAETSYATDFASFVKRWNADKWNLAVQGKAGYDGAKTYHDELDVLLNKVVVDRPAPGRAPAY